MKFQIIAAAVLILPSAAFADPFQYARHEVTDGVHLIYRIDPMRQPVEGNVTVIEQANGLVVVDSGGSGLAAARIMAQIAEISGAPVTHLINTHWHGDHNLGNASFIAAWPGVEVIAHENTVRHISGAAMDYLETNPAELEAARPIITTIAETGALPDGTELPEGIVTYASYLHEDFDTILEATNHMPVTPPTVSFSDTMVLDDDVRPVELHYFGRGNTDGDAVIWLPEQRVVITGDLVVIPTPYGFGSYAGEWIETLGAINALEYEYLIPGHGPPQVDTAYVDQLIALISETRTQVAALVAEGNDLEGVRAGVDLSVQQAQFAQGDSWIASRFNAWWVLPFVEAAFNEATGVEIIQGE